MKLSRLLSSPVTNFYLRLLKHETVTTEKSKAFA
jgi:hypothetical protein